MTWVNLPIPTDEGSLSRAQRTVMRLADGDECRVRTTSSDELEAVVDTSRGGCVFRDEDGEAVDVAAVWAPDHSGPNIPEAQRNTVQLHLRVDPAILQQLDKLCSSRGLTRSALVSHLIGRE